jgi:hypothetical protein
MGPWFGYYSCDHLVTGFEVFALAPVGLGLWGLLFGVSVVLLARRAPKGRRASVILLHLVIALFTTSLSLFALPPAGRWIWEQAVLRPRHGAMVEFAQGTSVSPAVPFEISGYRFERAERTPHGAMFYTIEAGGPFVSSGIYLSLSTEYRGFQPPQGGEPQEARWVKPTSIPGLFRFVTRH